MTYKQLLCLCAVVVLLIGCGPSISKPVNSYIYQGINFGSDRNEIFKKGVQDACRTADGYYTKDHKLFKYNESYRVGWENGRLLCKGQ